MASDSHSRAEYRRREIERLVTDTGAARVLTRHNLHFDKAVFDATDPQIKEDVVRMVLQYLRDEGYHAAALTLQDEANVKLADRATQQGHARVMRRALLDGDWAEVRALCKRRPFRHHKSFLYAVYRQAFLELVDDGEMDTAFSVLMDRLKPLELHASDPSEFRDLCYVLTCKSVRESPHFKDWDGAKGTSRERLVEQFESLLDAAAGAHVAAPFAVPPARLVTLLQQAVARQIAQSRYHPRVLPKVDTLLDDYRCFTLPNRCRATLRGHTANVKSIEFVGEEGAAIASGSSDNSLRLWDTATGRCLRVFERAHTSRIWDLSSQLSGRLLASASGDATVKIWNLHAEGQRAACVHTLTGHDGDVYAVQFHGGQQHVVSGGYDKTVRLWDVRSGKLKQTFKGHAASVSSAIFNPFGNLIMSGSKDSSIRVWDVMSGLCIRTISSHLGEVTSVSVDSGGGLLLSASKDNSNRLWDLRMSRPIRKFRGHQNTSKNFVRAAFGPAENLIVGGSEDGLVYVWDVETGYVLQRLKGHAGMVYACKWNAHQSLLASCADDYTVRTWYYDDSRPLYADEQGDFAEPPAAAAAAAAAATTTTTTTTTAAATATSATTTAAAASGGGSAR